MPSQAPIRNSDRVDSPNAHGQDKATPITSLDHYPVVSVEIERLTLEGSPRLAGEDLEHARMLASVQDKLPPITVRRQTMQVIDGRHRIHAALLNGRSVIDARLVDCTERTAFALAVRENIAHGLPLSLADRRAAAVSIMDSHPHWSDRVVAEQTGLSDKTVSALRAANTVPGAAEQSARLGRDGRLRPLNSAARRRRAAAMLKEDPTAGLREIARSTGLSPATVRDVRIRIDEGKDPVPARYSNTGTGAATGHRAGAGANRAAGVAPRADSADQGGESASAQPAQQPVAPRRSPSAIERINRNDLLAKLMGDPSLKFNDSGRNLLRWLDRYSVNPENCETLAPNIPDHWALPIANLARSCATAWMLLAEQLEQRSADETGP